MCEASLVSSFCVSWMENVPFYSLSHLSKIAKFVARCFWKKALLGQSEKMLNLATKWLSWQRCSTVCSNVCHGLFRFTVITVNVAKYFTYEHKSASAWCIIISNMVMFSYSYSIFIRTCSFIVLLHYIQITVLFTHVLGYSHIHNSSLFHLYSYSTDVVYMLKGCLHRMLELILCRIFFICKSLLQSDI